MNLRLVLLLPVLLLAGCASTGLPPLPESGRPATLVIYQPLSSDSDARLPFIYVDGYNLGRMGIGDVKTVAVAPGSHHVSLREPLLLWPGQESAVTDISVSAGQTGYVRFARKRVGVSASGGAETLPELGEVGAAEGEAHQ